MDAAEARAWLHGLIRPDARPYRERARHALPTMTRLLACVGDPHARLRAVHVAGSKGKGSTALMTEALLEAAGMRTGTYTSPHLQRWTERVRIGGREIPESAFVEALTRLRPHVERLAADDPARAPSFFDALTVAALWLFERERVDVAIVETGLGGRFDATNVVRPAVACVTTVEHEHADKLGPGLADIAAHKAGIVKPGCVVVVGELPPAAAAEVERAVVANACPALRLGTEIELRSDPRAGGQDLIVTIDRLRVTAHLAHPAPQMAANAALALACVHALGDVADAALPAAAEVLASVRLPGRMEVLGRAPWLVVDAAHTPDSVAALAACLDRLPPGARRFALSLSVDKDPGEVLAPLLARAASVVVTSAEPLRSMPAERLAEGVRRIAPALEVTVESDPRRAVQALRAGLRADEVGCLAGSTYLAGIARDALGA